MLCAGFKLESLLKLVDCRGSNDCKSLLHFILDQLLQDAPQIEALPKELLTVQPAGKLQVCRLARPGTLHGKLVYRCRSMAANLDLCNRNVVSQVCATTALREPMCFPSACCKARFQSAVCKVLPKVGCLVVRCADCLVLQAVCVMVQGALESGQMAADLFVDSDAFQTSGTDLFASRLRPSKDLPIQAMFHRQLFCEPL